MTSTPHHLASMSSDEPRGYGVRGDVRKRLEAQHQAHPDPAVCELMARAWDEGMRTGSSRAMRRMSDEPNLPLASGADNPYRSAP